MKNKYKKIFKDRTTNKKSLNKIISEIHLKDLTKEETESIVNNFFILKDLTEENICNFLLKFKNIEMDALTMPMYILLNNKNLEFILHLE